MSSSARESLETALEELDFVGSELERALTREGIGREARAEIQGRVSARRFSVVARLVSEYAALPRREAIDRLTNLIRDEAVPVEAYLARGVHRHSTGDVVGAEDDYLMAAALEPDRAEPHLRLAELHDSHGRRTRALYAYHAYLRTEADPTRRLAAEHSARDALDSIRPRAGLAREGKFAQTPERLQRLLDVLSELAKDARFDGAQMRQLSQRYSARLAELTEPPPQGIDSTLDFRSVADTPPVAAMVVQPVPDAVVQPGLQSVTATGAAMVDRAVPSPRQLAEAVAPPVAERQTEPPKQPRAPINWGAMFTALLSERTLTTILAFGVLLVAVSSIALLVDQWRSAASYTDVWPRIQAILVGQFLMFLIAGHIVKERLRLRLSGLAIITLGALWIPFNMGAWMFREFVAPGDVVLPGLGLPLDLPLAAWLIVAAASVPTWFALTVRYRGHLLTHGTVAAIGATVALALAVLGLDWEWSVASLAVVAVPLMFVWGRLKATAFQAITAPLFWTAQAALVGVCGVLFGFWAAGTIASYPLAMAGLAGSGLYVLAYRYTSQRRYQYLLAGLPAVSALYSLAESGLVPLRYLDLPLLALAVVYLLAGRSLRGRYETGILTRVPSLQPSTAIGYVLLGAAITWPQFHEVSRTIVLFATTAVAAASAWEQRQPVWTWAASGLLVAAFVLAVDLAGVIDAGYGGLTLAALSIAYLLGARLLKRAPEHAIPAFAGAFALALAGTAWAFSDDPFDGPAPVVAALPVVAVTLVGLWRTGTAGRDEAVTQIIGFARKTLGYELSREGLDQGRQAAGIVLLSLVCVAVATWTSVFQLWAGMPAYWRGVDLLVLAGILAACSTKLKGRGEDHARDARVLRSWGLAVAIAAPVYHIAISGWDWGLAGILYAVVAYLAVGASPVRHSVSVVLAATLFPLPAGLTLWLSGIAVSDWAAFYSLLALVYLGIGVSLNRRRAAAPVFAIGACMVAAALVTGGIIEPAGRAMRWSLPLAAVFFGVSAIAAQSRSLLVVDRVAHRVAAQIDFRATVDTRREWTAIACGGLVAVLLPAWISSLLVWVGAPVAAQAYNALGWAFAFALLPTLLRSFGRRYAAASLVGSGIAAAVAIVVAAAVSDAGRVPITAVLYGVAALGLVVRTQWRVPLPVYFAAGLVAVPFMLTLDQMQLDPLLWATPLMFLAVAYVGLSWSIDGIRILRARAGKPLSSPLAHVGWGLSVLAVAWTGFWVLARLAGAAPDTPLDLAEERAFVSLALFLGSLAYAAAAYRLRAQWLAHVFVWVLAGAAGIGLVAVPLSLRHVANAIAVAALVGTITGLALARGRSPTVRRIAETFTRPAMWGGHGASAIAVALASLDLFERGGPVWTANATYLMVVGQLVGVALVQRNSIALMLAAALFGLPFSLGANELLATGEPLALPSAVLAFGWTALSIVYLVGGSIVERRNARWAIGPISIGYMLLAAAVYASLGSAARQSVVFGAVVAIAAISALRVHRGAATVVPNVAAKALIATPDTGRRVTSLGFVWIAALLTPLWSLELLALFTTRLADQGLVLALLAPAFLAIALALGRAGLRQYAYALGFAGYGMTLIAPVLAAEAYGASVASLAIASATLIVAAYLSPHRRRSVLAHFLALILLTATVLRAFEPLDFDRVTSGFAVLILGAAYTLASLHTFGESYGANGAGRHGPISSFLRAFLRRSSPATAAGGRIGGLALSVAGLLLTLPGAAPVQPLTVIAFAVAAALFAIVAFRLRVRLMLWFAAASAVTGYVLALGVLGIDRQYAGLGLIPGGLAALAAGWSLYRFSVRSGPTTPQGLDTQQGLDTPQGTVASKGPARFVIGAVGRGATLLGWHAPLLVAGYGLVVAAPALSLEYEIERLGALLATTGVFSSSLVALKSRTFAIPTLLSAHLTWAAFVTLTTLGLALPQIGLLFIPPAVAMVALMGTSTGQNRNVPGIARIGIAWPGTPRIGTARLGTSGIGIWIVAFFALDFATSVILSAFADWSGIVMCGLYSVLAAVATHRTGVRILPYASTAFLTGAVIFTSRMLSLAWSESAVVWATQGLLMWWAGQGVRYLTQLRRQGGEGVARLALWQQPLRNAGLRLSWFALAFVVATLAYGATAPERVGSSMRDASAVMAVLGLLYVGMSLVSHRIWFGYVAAALLIGSWTVQAIDLEIPNAQAYAIPVGLYLLGLSYFERRRQPSAAPGQGKGAARSKTAAALPAAMELGAVMLLVVSAFLQSATDNPGWAYAVLLAVESVALVLWGALNRSRFASLGGVIGFVADVLYQTGDLLSGMSGAVVGLTVGLAIVVVIAMVERKRAQLIRIGREWASPAGSWRW